ncbi:MAG: hypothetical protein UIM26_08070 [Longicatena sp.]|nr:hypothetical protein [Longicatena sp.]
MKKLIPFALAAGAAAGYAIYKLKKAHDKKIIDLDEALLEEELLDDEDENKIFNLSDKIEEAVEEVDTVLDAVVTEVSDVANDLEDAVVEVVEEVEAVCEPEATTEEVVAEVVVEEETTTEPAEDEFDEVFVNLKKKMF